MKFYREKAKYFEVFPNPCNKEFTIYSKTKNLINRIEIYDAMGKLVKKHNCPSQNSVTIRFNQTSGIYFAKIIDDSNNYIETLSFVKE